MAEHHEHGSMDITAQERAFAGLMTWTKRVAIFSICVLIFMAIFNS